MQMDRILFATNCGDKITTDLIIVNHEKDTSIL